MTASSSTENLPPIILALDTPELDTAKAWLGATQGLISAYKIGLEFFSRYGADGVKSLANFTDATLFLDMKLHDIPNTVGAAAEQLALLKPKYLTVHASGGVEMMSAAVASAPEVSITAVTILTSLSAIQLVEIGYVEPPLESAIRLAGLAKSAGARAIVCSPLEIAGIRDCVGDGLVIITPGIRPASSTRDDQARTMDPRSALAAGANFLVIGRPITQAWGSGAEAMRAQAQAIADEVM